jgi:methionyl-tRNA synthetase
MDDLQLTTALPFVNAAPHLGHALEYVQADVVARHARARGRPVRFLTGTDEHAVKNVLAAARAGVPVSAFVADNAGRFRHLADALQVSYDDFIRTSADARHAPVVAELWRRCSSGGDLYRAEYRASYCAGCEEFRADPCPEHDRPLELVEEENWFFRLSAYAGQLRTLITSGQLRIEPDARRNEVLGFLDGDVRDLSVSRPRARVGNWGIPVPGDPEQVIYVWFDALAGYVSAPGLDGWSNAAERRHVIGKGILRFHAVIWPALLLAAGLPLPDALLVHDYVTVGGRKIGKSLGNSVDPKALVERYGADAVRWWCACDVSRIGETSFSESRLAETVNRDLAHGVGNLVQRVVALAAGGSAAAAVPGRGSSLAQSCRATTHAVDEAVDRLDLRRACEAIVALVGETNRYLEQTAPWHLPPEQRRPVLDTLLHATSTIIDELRPFVPGLATRAAARLHCLQPGPPLVPRLFGAG